MVTTSDPDVRGETKVAQSPAAPSAAANLATGQTDGAGYAWMRRRWIVPAGLIVLGVLLFIGYLAQARTMPVHLDISSASGPQTLQAWDMLHGNWLLSGWQVGDVSYYTTELPLYALVEWARGLSGDTVHIAAALTYTLIVLLAALLAKGRATGREALLRLLIPVGIMLAPALVTGTSIMLSGPDHTGTQVPLLLIWLAVDRLPARWWLPVLVTVLLTWAAVADTLVLAEGVAPIVAVCAVRMFRRRRGPLSEQWFDLSLAVGALISVVASRAALILIRQAGGFVMRPATVQLASAHSLGGQLGMKLKNVLEVFSADVFGLPGGHFPVAATLHLVGVILVLWAVGIAFRRFFTADLVVQLLTVAFVVLLAAYIFGNRPLPNEVIGLLPIGAVLAGRLLAARVASIRLKQVTLVPILSVALVCYGAILVQSATATAGPSYSWPSAAWFRAHHLTAGLGGFGETYNIAVSSGDHIQVRAARIFDGTLVTTPWETDAAWFNSRRNYANFFIENPPNACGNSCHTYVALSHEFGPPAATYQVGQYRVLVWHKNLLVGMPTLSWCQPGGWAWNTGKKPSSKPCAYV